MCYKTITDLVIDFKLDRIRLSVADLGCDFLLLKLDTN